LGKKIIEKRKEKKTQKKKYGRQIKRETLEDVCVCVFIYFQSLCYMFEDGKRIQMVQNESCSILQFQKMLGKFERMKNNNQLREKESGSSNHFL